MMDQVLIHIHVINKMIKNGNGIQQMFTIRSKHKGYCVTVSLELEV